MSASSPRRLGSPSRPTVRQALRQAARRRQPGGAVVAARDGREPVALVVLPDGRAFCMPDRCPHDGGLLSDGFLDGEHLVCARHGWEFDATTGACPGRAHACVEARPVAAPVGPLFAVR